MNIKTFIVDDEPLAIDQLLHILNMCYKNEIEVIGFNNIPQKALDQILKLKPDIVFIDMEMPGISGLKLLELLKQGGYCGEVVFVTAFTHYSIKALRAKAFDYIEKPIDIDDLQNCITRYKDHMNHILNPNTISYFNLSPRESELIKHLSKGLTSEEIAEKMFLSRNTIDTHRKNILQKTGARNSIELLNMLFN